MRLFLTTLLLMVSPGVFAFSLSLSPNPADQSVQYLGSIFGHVGNLLQGNASPMIGLLFQMFNYAVIMLAAILISYTLFVGVLNTANDGEVMGKKWSSIWVAFRSVLGIVLLIPTKLGYSMMQYFVIWVVLQGVGAADSLWNMSIDVLAKGGSVSPPSVLTGSSSPDQNLYTAASNLLSAQVCVDTMYAIYGTNAHFACEVEQITGSNNQYQIVCGGSITDQNGNGTNYAQACGTVTPNYQQIAAQYPDGTISNQAIYQALQVGLNQMLVAIQPAARAIAYDTYYKLQGLPNSQLKHVPNNAITNAVNNYQRTVGAATANYITQENQNRIKNLNLQQCNVADINKMTNGLNDIWQNASSYQTCMVNDYVCPISNFSSKWHSLTKQQQSDAKALNQKALQMQNDGESEASFVHQYINQYQKANHCYANGGGIALATPAQMKATGWFDAGQYYLTIAEQSYLHANNMALGNSTGSGLPQLQSTLIDTGSLPQDGIWVSYAAAVNAYTNADSASYFTPSNAPAWMTGSEWPPNNNQGAEYVIAAIDTAMNQWSITYNALQGNDSGGTYAQCPKNDTTCTTHQAHIQNRMQYYDPIMLLQQFGHYLIADSINGYKQEGAYFSQKSFGEWLSNIFGKIFGNEDIDRMISAMWYLPLGFVVLSMMMAAGMMLEIYMPLIPFILFTLGGIGWLLGVIEAMVAAPIVCFGIMHPNSQNDFVGRSEPAVMLIINTFLRPVLMVIGMMLGIGLIYISIAVINSGFSKVVGSMLTYGSNLRDPFTATCLMAIYALFVVLVVQKCFSLVSIIPDNVLRWIQGGDVTRQQFGEMGQIEQQMSQKLGSAANQLSQGVASTGQQQAQGQIQIAGNNQSAEDSLLRM